MLVPADRAAPVTSSAKVDLPDPSIPSMATSNGRPSTLAELMMSTTVSTTPERSKVTIGSGFPSSPADMFRFFHLTERVSGTR